MEQNPQETFCIVDGIPEDSKFVIFVYLFLAAFLFIFSFIMGYFDIIVGVFLIILGLFFVGMALAEHVHCQEIEITGITRQTLFGITFFPWEEIEKVELSEINSSLVFQSGRESLVFFLGRINDHQLQQLRQILSEYKIPIEESKIERVPVVLECENSVEESKEKAVLRKHALPLGKLRKTDKIDYIEVVPKPECKSAIHRNLELWEGRSAKAGINGSLLTLIIIGVPFGMASGYFYVSFLSSMIIGLAIGNIITGCKNEFLKITDFAHIKCKKTSTNSTAVVIVISILVLVIVVVMVVIAVSLLLTINSENVIFLIGTIVYVSTCTFFTILPDLCIRKGIGGEKTITILAAINILPLLGTLIIWLAIVGDTDQKQPTASEMAGIIIFFIGMFVILQLFITKSIWQKRNKYTKKMYLKKNRLH